MWMGGEQKPQRDRKRQKLIVTWKERRPAETLPTHLNNLFQTLAAAMSLKDAYEVEDLIREAWTECRDPAAAAAMRQEIAGIAKQEYEEAETVLNTLIQAQPRWAEVWNKGATLFFYKAGMPRVFRISIERLSSSRGISARYLVLHKFV